MYVGVGYFAGAIQVPNPNPNPTLGQSPNQARPSSKASYSPNGEHWPQVVRVRVRLGLELGLTKP